MCTVHRNLFYTTIINSIVTRNNHYNLLSTNLQKPHARTEKNAHIEILKNCLKHGCR